MSETTYDSKAELVVNVIDIAIDSFKNNPPEKFEQNHINLFIETYLNYRNKVINPEPKFHNITSLKYIFNDVLTYFQEGSGKAVDIFWKEINVKKLAVIRVNKFEKIIKRGKIRNHNEYDMIIDLYNSYTETKMLSNLEVNEINELISNFEKGHIISGPIF